MFRSPFLSSTVVSVAVETRESFANVFSSNAMFELLRPAKSATICPGAAWRHIAYAGVFSRRQIDVNKMRLL
jgi:hypothetical protein